MEPLSNIRKKLQPEIEQQKRTEVVQEGNITIRVTAEKVTLTDLFAEDKKYYDEDLYEEDSDDFD